MSGDGPLGVDGPHVNYKGLWIASPGDMPAVRDQLDRARRCAEAEAENARLRAELAARPDLTELRQVAHAAATIEGPADPTDEDESRFLDAIYHVYSVACSLLAADPAPAPDPNFHCDSCTWPTTECRCAALDTVTITGSVHDAGGGHIDVLVDRDTLSYPWISARCTLIVEKKS